MLPGLIKKKNNSLKFPSHFIAGIAGFVPAFNPLTLPTYQAGYIMNNTTDVPAGSLNPVYGTGQWFDGVVLGVGSKLMTRGNSTSITPVNGFKSMLIDNSSGRLLNTTIDVFNGVVNFTLLIGFKRPAATLGYHILFSCQSAGVTAAVIAHIYTLPNGTLNCYLSNSGGTTNIVPCVTPVGNNYNDNNWHVAVVTFNQNTKTITLTTELETVSGTNAAFVPGVLTPDTTGDFRLGQWAIGTSNGWWPGSIADVIILNSVAPPAQINDLLSWERTRLGV